MDVETIIIPNVEYEHLLEERKNLNHELKLAWDYIKRYGNYDKRCPRCGTLIHKRYVCSNCHYDSSVELEK